MTVNPDKFLAMALQKQDKNTQTNSLNIDNKTIETSKSVKLLVITIDSQKCSMKIYLTSVIKLPCN